MGDVVVAAVAAVVFVVATAEWGGGAPRPFSLS